MTITSTSTLMKWAAALCMLAVVSSSAPAQSKVATTAGQFLGISVGPRAIGMGSAYVAATDDATLLFWNPGAVPQSGRSELVLSNTNWLVGTKFRWLGLALSITDQDAIGLSLTQLDYGEDEVTSVALPDGTGERWSAQDLSVGLTYARRLTDRFSIGGTVKYIEQRIWNESASTFAFDLGLLFITGFNDMRLGVSMSNFGGDLQLEGRDLLTVVDIDPQNSGGNKSLVGNLKTDPWAIPLTFRLGLAMDVYKDNLFRVTVAADAIRPNDNDSAVNLGGEASWNNLVFVRGGYKSIVGGETEEGLALGAGLRYGIEGLGNIRIDYSYSDFGVFGNVNTFALAIGF